MHPEITEMQVAAIFEAAAACIKDGIQTRPDIMVPLVGIVDELDQQFAVTTKAAKDVEARTGRWLLLQERD